MRKILSLTAICLLLWACTNPSTQPTKSKTDINEEPNDFTKMPFPTDVDVKKAQEMARKHELDSVTDMNAVKNYRAEQNSRRPLAITKPNPVIKVTAAQDVLPKNTVIKTVEKEERPVYKTVRTRRELPVSIKELMAAISDNNMKQAEKTLRKIKTEVNLGKMVASDVFLVKQLEVFIYHRLGEDDEVLKIVEGNLDYLKKSLPITIDKVFPVDSRKAIGHGNYTKLKDNTFVRGGFIYIYMELENYTETQLKDGKYSISLKLNMTLKDPLGNVVHDMNHKVGSAQKPLEDFINDIIKKNVNINKRSSIYQCFKVPLPKNVNPGQYDLNVEIVDLNDSDERSSKKTINISLK